ncbi:MAG: hypothetical protein RMX97_12380 [Nostoc sp. DedQUE11]|nr:hypothetical protein [Nostoc sp. DedQUE11]
MASPFGRRLANAALTKFKIKKTRFQKYSTGIAQNITYVNKNKGQAINGDRTTYPPKQITLLIKIYANPQHILAAFDKIIAQLSMLLFA